MKMRLFQFISANKRNNPERSLSENKASPLVNILSGKGPNVTFDVMVTISSTENIDDFKKGILRENHFRVESQDIETSHIVSTTEEFFTKQNL